MESSLFNSVEMRTDDRLKSGADKSLFFLVFVIGSAAMLGEKWFGAPLWVPAITGAVAIILFCLITWVTPRYRLREDRIGDSAYYLGFLFTLGSLAVTLYQFTELGGVESVISGFGIALATTIVGLFLRVVFQQLREDPVEIDQEVRRTLRDEVDHLQRDIRLSVEGLASLRERIDQEMAQAMGEGLKAILKDSRRATVAQLRVFKNSIEATMAGVNDAVNASTSHAAEIRKSTGRLLKAVDSLAEKIEQTRSPTDGFKEKIDEFTRALDLMLKREAERIDRNRQSSDAILGVYRAMENRAVDAAVAMEQCKAVIDGMHATIGQSSSIATQLAEGARTVFDSLLERSQRHIDLLVRVEQASKESEESVKVMRANLQDEVRMSAEILSTLQRNVIQATELIVKELSAR